LPNRVQVEEWWEAGTGDFRRVGIQTPQNGSLDRVGIGRNLKRGGLSKEKLRVEGSQPEGAEKNPPRNTGGGKRNYSYAFGNSDAGGNSPGGYIKDTVLLRVLIIFLWPNIQWIGGLAGSNEGKNMGFQGKHGRRKVGNNLNGERVLNWGRRG